MVENPKRILSYIAIVLVFFAVFAVGASSSHASISNTTITYVDDDTCPALGTGTIYNPYCKIQDAVDNTPEYGEIHVAEGVYTGVQTKTGLTTYTYTQVVFIEKALVLRGGYDASNWAAEPDPSHNESIIDAERSGRGITIVAYSDRSVTIDGFTITGGDYTNLGNPDGEYYIGVCRRTGYDCGGGLFAFEAKVYLLNSYVYDNYASNPDGDRSGDGGGVYYYSTGSGSSIVNTVILNNSAGPNGLGGGMGIVYSEDVTITRSEFKDNYAQHSGGGLYIYDSDQPITIESTNFVHNRALNDGGAIYAAISPGTLVIDRVKMADNQARQNGTALYLQQVGIGTSIFNLSNILVSGSNSHYDNSNANVFYLTNSATLEVHLDYITAAENLAESFAKFQTGNNEYSVLKVYLKNDLLQSFTNAFVAREVPSGVMTILYDHMLFDKVANVEVIEEGAPDFVAGSVKNGAAKLDSTYHLTSESPAIDAGIPLTVDRDIDNDPRSNVAPDIGADEYTLKVYAPLILNK